uniref:Uncharacterized protein n=1 Tax=Cairina moschata TaxID=8855 RepID=A0A8C3GHJ0_CAIMO
MGLGSRWGCGVTPPCPLQVTSPCQAAPPPELRRNTAPVRRSEHLGSTKSLSSARQHSTLPRTLSAAAELDLSYVSERLLALSFPPALDERRLRGHLRDVAQMLRSRHRERYAVFNLSEKRRDLARLHPKVQDFGWPDLHAPPLDRLCSICKALEGWLRAHPQ